MDLLPEPLTIYLLPDCYLDLSMEYRNMILSPLLEYIESKRKVSNKEKKEKRKMFIQLFIMKNIT